MNIKKIWYKIKEIPIIGVPYEKHIGSVKVKKMYQKQSKQVEKFGLESIQKIEGTLDSLSIIYFADCGTLLGVIRNHKLITWDPDIDYGIVVNKEFDWKKLEAGMEKNGYKKIKEWHVDDFITEQTYTTGNMAFDVFAHYPEKDILISYGFQKKPGEKYAENEYGVYEFRTCPIKKIRKESLQGLTVNVPDNAEEYLAFLYNDDWREPNPNWVAYSGKGCSFLENKKAILKIY